MFNKIVSTIVGWFFDVVMVVIEMIFTIIDWVALKLK